MNKLEYVGLHGHVLLPARGGRVWAALRTSLKLPIASHLATICIRERTLQITSTKGNSLGMHVKHF